MLAAAKSVPIMRKEFAPLDPAEYQSLCGTRHKSLSHAARLWHAARSLGFLRVTRKLLRRTGRHRQKHAGDAAGTELELLKRCTWLDQVKGLRVIEGTVTSGELLAFQRAMHYPRYYYYAGRRIRYSLWHHVGWELAELCSSSVVLDLGAQAGLWGRMARRHAGCQVIDLDLEYRKGRHGHRIGSSACRIPLDDCSLTHVVSFCAFNCFEGNADSAVIHEAARVLHPGGQLIIVPLCIGDAFVNLYDPLWVDDIDRLDDGATAAAMPGWGNPFGRWYDRNAFERRILDHAKMFDVEIHRIFHPFHVDEGFGAMFAARLIRRPFNP